MLVKPVQSIYRGTPLPNGGGSRHSRHPSSVEDLIRTFSHAGVLNAIPTERCDVSQFDGRIIALRTNIVMPGFSYHLQGSSFSRTDVYLHGAMKERDLGFDIYISEQAHRNEHFPTSPLRATMKRFAVLLNRHGYSFNENSLTFFESKN